eukprot:gene15825-7143_t
MSVQVVAIVAVVKLHVYLEPAHTDAFAKVDTRVTGLVVKKKMSVQVAPIVAVLMLYVYLGWAHTDAFAKVDTRETGLVVKEKMAITVHLEHIVAVIMLHVYLGPDHTDAFAIADSRGVDIVVCQVISFMFCVDGDYCALGTHSCSNNATCISGTGSYRCICNSGFTGSGYSCMPGDGSSSKSASKAGIYIGGVVGGAVGGVFIILIIITVVLCCCKRSHKSEVPSTAIQTSHSQTATSATYIVANTSANGAFMQNTESLEQNMTQPAVIFSEGKASYPPAGLAPFRLHTARVAPDINTIPPPDYQTAIVPNSTYPTAPPPYSTSMESTNQPPPQNPSFFGPS